jgi:hypothetical protein
MSGITDPAQEYFKDGLWGWVTDQWKKLVATAGGALHVQIAGQEANVDVNIAAQAADVEVKQTASADLTPGVCGWDGSSWRKLPMLWGYSDAYAETKTSNDVAAGNHFVLSSAVPAGEVWVVENLAGRCSTANPTHLNIGVYDGSTYHHLVSHTLASAWQVYFHTARCVLKEGWQVYVQFMGCALNDDLNAYFVGYKMKVAE